MPRQSPRQSPSRPPARTPSAGGRPNPGLAQPRPRRRSSAPELSIDDRYRAREPIEIPEEDEGEVETNMKNRSEYRDDVPGLRERLRRRLMDRTPGRWVDRDREDEEEKEDKPPRTRSPVGRSTPKPVPVPTPGSRDPRQSPVSRRRRK